jgi:D-alanine transaminase
MRITGKVHPGTCAAEKSSEGPASGGPQSYTRQPLGENLRQNRSSTAWIVKNRTLISRPLSEKVLPGITRASVLAFIAESGFAFDQRTFTLTEALAADEAFITSATNLVMPVVSIDGQMIGKGVPGTTALRLRELYIGYARKGGALG